MFFYVAILELCSLDPIATAVKEYALPMLETQPVLLKFVEGLLPEFGSVGPARKCVKYLRVTFNSRHSRFQCVEEHFEKFWAISARPWEEVVAPGCTMEEMSACPVTQVPVPRWFGIAHGGAYAMGRAGKLLPLHHPTRYEPSFIALNGVP